MPYVGSAGRVMFTPDADGNATVTLVEPGQAPAVTATLSGLQQLPDGTQYQIMLDAYEAPNPAEQSDKA